MKDFYRIENVYSGNGPYTSGSLSGAYDAYADDDDDDPHPNPFEEGLWLYGSFDYRKDVCGFESLDMLRAWFRLGMIEELHDEGDAYIIRHYQSDDVRTAIRQSVCEQSALKFVKDIQLSDVYDLTTV